MHLDRPKALLTRTDSALPTNLPVPEDDGACSHLPGVHIPSVSLPSTSGDTVDLSLLPGRTILFCYPRTAAPGETITDEWNMIPGARGCTPQACAFRDAMMQLLRLGVHNLFGMSTQDIPYQQEAREQNHLPYHLLSDEKLDFANALKLPLFEWKGRQLIKRLALVIEGGIIVRVWYPVFPPDQNAAQVVEWLKSNQ